MDVSHVKQRTEEFAPDLLEAPFSPDSMQAGFHQGLIANLLKIL
jgi:hypothetical protein